MRQSYLGYPTTSFTREWKANWKSLSYVRRVVFGDGKKRGEVGVRDSAEA